MGTPGVVWSRDGKQLYFRDSAGPLMAVDVQPQGSEFHSALPRQIFTAPGGVPPWMPRPTVASWPWSRPTRKPLLP